MPKNYVTYVPMCKKRKSRFYLFHVPYARAADCYSKIKGVQIGY